MTEPDWRHLPSLSALRAFEATARLDGFSAAARALNVTPAAVAQQVRGLESDLGVSLVVRQGRGLALTPEGTRLTAALRDGFATIAAGVEDLRRNEARRGVRVSTTQGFAQWILMPALSRFWSAHPEIPVALDITSRLADLQNGTIDLAIRAGALDQHWPGTVTEALIRSRYLVLAAPQLAARITSPADMARMPWILDPRNDTEARWLAQMGIDRDSLRVTEVASPVLEVGSAVQGYGLMFGVESIVKPELDAGRLVEVPTEGLPSAAYAIVTASGPRRARVQTFIDWMKSDLGCAPENTDAIPT
ncbi:LysR substrate-binding domain-containing protein [Pseudooceanicola sp. LIPI14-2-Ac024]|uniref:LysR substrate-binding domain-containing protein n=1 Tax=Pseudooceanicola sp. LIPI14-2-Ac024 TaxID=3344875 RepID=UPI0035D00288